MTTLPLVDGRSSADRSLWFPRPITSCANEGRNRSFASRRGEAASYGGDDGARYSGDACSTCHDPMFAPLITKTPSTSESGQSHWNEVLRSRIAAAMNHEPWWRLVVAGCVVMWFTQIGVRMALRPEKFVLRAGRTWWRQGEMERTKNRDTLRVIGVVIAAGSLWVFYNLLTR